MPPQVGDWEPIEAAAPAADGWEQIPSPDGVGSRRLQTDDSGWEPIDSGGQGPGSGQGNTTTATTYPPSPGVSSYTQAPSVEPALAAPVPPVSVRPPVDFGSPAQDRLVDAARQAPDAEAPVRLGLGPGAGEQVLNRFAKSAGQSIVQGVEQLARIQRDVADAQGGGAAPFSMRALLAQAAGPQVPVVAQAVAETVLRGGEAAKGAMEQALPTDPERDRRFLTGTLPAAAGTLAALFVPAAGVASRGPQAARLAGTLGGALLGGGAAYDEAKAGGATEDQARLYSQIGMALGSTEVLGGGQKAAATVGRLIPGAGRAILEAIKGGSTEALQEALQQLGQNLAAARIWDPNRTAMKGTGEGAAAGGILGFVMNALTRRVGPAAPRPPPVPKAQATVLKSFDQLPDIGGQRTEDGGQPAVQALEPAPVVAPSVGTEASNKEVPGAELQGPSPETVTQPVPDQAGTGSEPATLQEGSTGVPAAGAEQIAGESAGVQTGGSYPPQPGSIPGPATIPEAPRPKGPAVLGQATKPPSRSTLNKLKFADLKSEMRRQKDANGIPLWETQGDRTMDAMQRRLLQHRAWYMDRAGLKERAPMSPEMKEKMRRGRNEKLLKKDAEDWADWPEYVQKSRAEFLARDDAQLVGSEVFLGDEDAVWRVVDVEPDVSAPPPGQGGPLIRGWRYVIHDGNEYRTVKPDELQAVQPESEENALRFFEELGGADEQGQGAGAGVVEGAAGVAPGGAELAGEGSAGSAAGPPGGGQPEQPFALEGLRPGQLEAERASAELRAEISNRQAERLTGTAGDLTADLFGPLEGETPLFNQRRDVAPAAAAGGVQDVGAAMAAKARGGFALLSAPGVRDFRRKVRSLLSTNQGVGSEVLRSFEQYAADVERGVLTGSQEQSRLVGVENALTAAGFPKDRVKAAIYEYQTGTKTDADLAAMFGLAPTAPELAELRDVKRAVFDRAQKIAAWDGLPAASADHIRNNVHYLTRRYMRHILGVDYDPPATAVQNAQVEVENGLADEIAAVERRASDIRGVRAPWDVIRYLNTGDPTLLAGLAPSRRPAAEALLDNYRSIRDLIGGLALSGNNVVALQNAQAVQDAARGVVDYYLTRDMNAEGGGVAGGVSTANLAQRYLGPVFRSLYGEIKDPVVAQKATAEVQGRMLAQMTLINRLLSDAENVAWGHRPDPARGFVREIGKGMTPQQARMRYGPLAGKYATEDMHRLLEGEKHVGAVWKFMDAVWFAPQGVWRLGHVALNPRSAFRNLYSSVLGNAMGAGDLFQKTWMKRYGEAYKVITGYVRRQPAGIKAMAESADFFQPGASTSTFDIQQSAGAMTAGAPKRMIQKLARAYGMIDFMSKYAAYWSRRDGGWTHEQAVEHVRQMYQNRLRVPRVFGKISAAGVADYSGYTADAMRSSINQAKFAAAEAAQGRLGPAVGFVMSRGLWAASFSAAMAAAWAKVHQELRGGDDEERKVDVVSRENLGALRNMVATFDKNAPMWAWWETKPTGKKQLYYTVLGGQTFNPGEDWLMGALQGPASGQTTAEALAHNVIQSFDVGGYPNMLLRLATGKDLTGRRTPTGKGWADVAFGDPDPRAPRILKDAAVDLLMSMSGGALGEAVRSEMDIQARQLAGQSADVGLFARTDTPEDARAKMYRMIRTYRIGRSDMNKRLAAAVRPYAEAIDVSASMVNKEAEAVAQRGAATADQAAESKVGQRTRREYLDLILARVNDARRLAPDWYSPLTVSVLLTQPEIGLSKADAQYISGRLVGIEAMSPPYIPDVRRYLSPMQLYTPE